MVWNSLIEVRTIVYCDIQGHVAFKCIGKQVKEEPTNTDTVVTGIVKPSWDLSIVARA